MCTFYYPQLVEHRQIRGENQCAATLEVLSGPWIILKFHRTKNSDVGFIVYWRDASANVDDFIYFIDYMRQNDMLNESQTVEIRYIDKDTDNPSKFQSAQQQYAEQIAGAAQEAGSLAAAVRELKFTPINQVISTFSTEQIGMEYDR